MSYSNTHRFLVVLVSLAVVCSFVGAPVAAAAATSSDGLSETVSFSGSDDSDPDDSDSDDSDSDDGDTDDSDSDDGDTDDSDSDDGDTDDGDLDDRTLFDDEDETDSEERDDQDSEETDEDSPDDSDTSDSEESDSDTSDDSEVRDRINGSVDDIHQSLNGTIVDDSLEETDEPVDSITETTEETTEETTDLDTSTLTTSLEALLSHSQQVFSIDVSESTGTTTDVSETTSMSLIERNVFGAADEESADTDEASDDSASESGPMMAVGSGSGGQPVPSGPVGGAAAGIGIAAAAAVMRGSPLLAGVGASSSASTGGSSLLGSLLGKVRPFIFPLRYSRYDDSDPLEHEAREEVYEIVNETPGSYLSEVSKEADLPLSTTRHHIKVLEREDLVSGAKLRGKRRFYPAYAEGIELAAALNDESTASIIDAISRIGAASVSDLAEELDRDPSTISHHLQRLEEDAIITRERDGRAVVNKLSSEARTALEPETTPKPGQAGSAIAGGAD